MKSLKMSKVLGSIRKRNGNGNGSDFSAADISNGESPEATATRCVKAFCESGSPNQSGDEVLYLPPIVDAAESSPAAAAECARLIRKYLKRDYWTKPSYQYNAIMLIRILADNPGQTFTRNIDQKFADTVKELLRSVRNPDVRQMVMETLDSFEQNKAYDEGLFIIIEMWKKERVKAQEKAQKQHGEQGPRPPVPRTLNAPPVDPRSQNYFARNHTNRKLPDPVELAGRLEEARTSAKLLQQIVTNTPPAEVLDNTLIKEFADRCTSASRSIQTYMTAENPAPDNDTMEHLIDTNEQLQASLSLHQRAMLNSRKHVAAMGGSDSTHGSVSPVESERHGGSDAPSLPSRRANGKGKEREYEPAIAGPSRSHTPRTEDDPFKDPDSEHCGGGGASGSGAGATSSFYSSSNNDEPRLAFEPFHPGFETTPSYLDRQDSALGKEAMHGGATGVGATRNSSTTSDTRDRARTDASSDVYDVTPPPGPPPPPKSKEPIYRY
ncbi:hypothetical protein F5B20DRAFT_539409 [Whalleya microplaca]|nr:hypothetical protein F5B20DRAFT_539409 [Whalleya microplaca]